MAAVLHIDPDDELPAILERLPAGMPCVVVLPPHARALSSLVGAKLLGRRAAALDSRIAVVTGEHTVIAHARAAGVPVAATVDEAQRLLSEGAEETEDAGAAPAQDLSFPEEEGDEPRTGGTPGGAIRQAVPRAVFTAGALRAPPDVDDDDADLDATDGAAAASAAAVWAGQNGATAQRSHGAGATQGARVRRATPAAGAAAPPATASPAQAAGQRVRRSPVGWIIPAALLVLPLLLLLWLASYVLSGLLNPSATLTLHPRAGAVIGDATVLAVLNLPPSKRTADRVGMAQADQPEQYTVSLPVRGNRLLPDRAATGHLLLGNLTKKPLVVPAGTTFTTALNRVAFVSTKAITLAPAVETFATVTYGTGQVPIRAATAGSAGNVPAHAIVNVPAWFSGALKVENPAPTTGGTDRSERIVAPHDLTVAAASLFGALEQEARRDIARRHNWDVEQHTLYVVRSPVAPRLAPDRRSATLTLSLVLHAIYVHRSELRPAALAALQQALVPHTSLIASSVDWTATWQPLSASRQLVRLAVTGRTTAPFDVAGLLRAIRGRPIAEARSYLNRRTDLASARLDPSPPWADHVPNDVTRIHPIIAEAQ